MAQYSHDYDASYVPPMPVVDVTVQDIVTGSRSEPMTAIVDSGADGCLVPIKVIQDLNLFPVRKAMMRGVSGVGHSVDIYLVSMRIGPIAVNGIRVIGDRQGNELIIGRDVLNQLIVTLNGLAGEISVTG